MSRQAFRVFYDPKTKTIQFVFRQYKDLQTFNVELEKFLTTKEVFYLLISKIFKKWHTNKKQ